ncbi:MAG: type II toxin-antitoxin system HicB family antitoxin [Patescibacteria group bacterium]
MNKSTKVLNFTVLFEQDEDGYFVASVPNLSGCYTQGKTFEQAKRRIRQVIKLCLKDEKKYHNRSTSGFVGIDQVMVVVPYA